MTSEENARPRGRPALPVERILTAALELVDEQGTEALSMRSLAQRLESGTATLYRHFSSRAELIAAMIDRILGGVDLDPPTRGPWQQACMSFAQHMFDALSRHPNVASLLIEYTPVGPNALAGRELCLSILLENGFTPPIAAHAYATLARFVLGFAIQISGAAGPEHDAKLATAFHELDAAHYPATRATADELPVPLREEFAFGLQLIIAGLELLHR